MTIRFSAGLRAAVLSDFGLRAMMNYGVIELYTGDQPDSASLSPTGTLVGKITTNGDTFTEGSPTAGALRFELDPLGGLVKNGVWRLKGITTGDVGWWRWKWNSEDTDVPSAYFPRMDGAINESLLLTNTTVTAATDEEVVEFYVNILE